MTTPTKSVLLFALTLALAGLPASAAPDATSPAAPAQEVQPAVPAKPVNINTATRQELEKVPRIGKTLAERVIAGRPYASVDDLKKIEGFGEKTLEAARPFLTVE